MRLRIQIDGISHDIDSTDPKLLGAWVVEIFGRAIVNGITPATYITVQAFPSWVPTGNNGEGLPDWIADTRFMGGVHKVMSPRELIDALNTEVTEWEVAHADHS